MFRTEEMTRRGPQVRARQATLPFRCTFRAPTAAEGPTRGDGVLSARRPSDRAWSAARPGSGTRTRRGGGHPFLPSLPAGSAGAGHPDPVERQADGYPLPGTSAPEWTADGVAESERSTAGLASRGAG